MADKEYIGNVILAGSKSYGGGSMLFKPDEVANLKKGSSIFIEIKEGDVRVLKRNFCGVYELYRQETPGSAEYFEDLILFKNRYGSTHKRFPLYNITRQRLDIYPVVSGMEVKDILKWFGEYGKVIYTKSTKLGSITIDYYKWVSDEENTVSKFQIVRDREDITLNICVKNMVKNVQMAG